MCPVVGSYPGKDFTARSGRETRCEAGTVGDRTRTIKIYPGTRHSFFNDTGKSYDADAAKDAWRRTLEFFAEHVRSTR